MPDPAFNLESPTLKDGGWVAKAHIYDGFGYTGENLAPELRWRGAPAGTQSFSLTMFDPDAPRAGGWWHWLVLDIPADIAALPEGAAPGRGLPRGAIQIENDFGIENYGGPAPPPGGPHRYIFSLYALSAPRVDLPQPATPQAIAAVLDRTALAKATLTVLFGKQR